MTKLEIAHRRYLRTFQSLPDFVCSAIIYLLIGALPIEAEIHLKKLALLGTIIRSDNKTLLNLCKRQLAVKKYTSNSWFVEIERLLIMYNLPCVRSLIESKFTKNKFKSLVHKAVHNHWTLKLRSECMDKSTLIFCDFQKMSTRKEHVIWQLGSKI